MPDVLSRRRTDQNDSGDPGKLRALVVDDHQAYLQHMTEVVSKFGFEVETCSDGTTALALLRERPPFDLLIVDCEMPRMSGLAFITAVRAHERFADAYAMMVTAREDLQTKVTALRLGFDDYMTKSADEAEVTARLSAARRLIVRQRRLQQTVHELYGMAVRDDLTGLFNRRFFFAEAERLLGAGALISLVFFDLDDFKRVNDTFGHLVGDRLLRDVSALFLSRTRQEDLVARYGGDEFVMLVQDLPPQDVEKLAARIADDIAAVQWTYGTETFRLGVTTGVASSAEIGTPTMAQLLGAGDRDLYRNKWLRKNPGRDPGVYGYDETLSRRFSTPSEPAE